MPVINLFLTLFKISLKASMLIIIVLAVRFLLKKLHTPAWSIHILWLVILFRLLCPVSFDGNFSLFPASFVDKSVMRIEAIAASAAQPSADVTESMPSAPAAASPIQSETAPKVAPVAFDWRGGAAALWLAGILVLLFNSISAYMRLKRSIGPAVPLGGNRYESATIEAPFVWAW